MNVFRSASLVAFVLAAVSTPALAQQRAENEPFSRAYASALAGVAFDSDTTATFAAEYGERLHENVQAYANITYFDNLMSDVMRSNIESAAAALAASTGSAWTLQGRDQGLAFTVGAKVLVGSGAPVRPYVGAGVGALNLRRKITEPSLGDVTESFVEVFGLSDGNIGSTRTSTTMPLAEAIAGVNFVAGRTYIDVSYRYRHAFHAVEPLSFSQVAVGAGVRF